MVKVRMEFWKNETFVDVGYSLSWEYLRESGERGRKYLTLHISYSCLKYGAGMGEDWLLLLMATSSYILPRISPSFLPPLLFFFLLSLIFLTFFYFSSLSNNFTFFPIHFCPMLSSRFNYYSYPSFCFPTTF